MTRRPDHRRQDARDADLTPAGLDAVAVKPTELAPATAAALPVDLVTIDFEGTDHVPEPAKLRELCSETAVRVTVPVRADGFDPLGDDAAFAALPAEAGIVLVAGHPAYLSPAERERAIAPRLSAALDRAPDAWVGTEGIERLALASGATQFDLLGPDTVSSIRERRANGFRGSIAVYAPFALTEQEDDLLGALGAYAARRSDVQSRLTLDAAPGFDGQARAVLLDAIDQYAVTGTEDGVREQVRTLRDAGVDTVVGYPARGAVDLAAP